MEILELLAGFCLSLTFKDTGFVHPSFKFICLACLQIKVVVMSVTTLECSDVDYVSVPD